MVYKYFTSNPQLPFQCQIKQKEEKHMDKHKQIDYQILAHAENNQLNINLDLSSVLICYQNAPPL